MTALRKLTAWRPPASFPGRTLLVVLAVLAVALSAGAWWVQSDLDDREATETARIQALASAKDRVPAVLGYSHKTLDRDLPNALAQTTGTFREEYELLLADVIEPGARKGKVDTSAAVSDAAVVSADEDEVVVLMLLVQSTTRAKATVPEIGGSRVRVTMARDGGEWLVAALQPV